MSIFSLDNRFFLVTGGTRGIGRAISLQLARSGATVCANYVRNAAAADSLATEAAAANLHLSVVRADLTSGKGMAALLEEISKQGGKLDGLVHCAATGVHKSLAELTSRHFDWVFALNVKAFFELMRTLLPHFRRGARVIVLSSQGAVRAVPFYSLVGSSKGALESLARHLAAELAEKGIRVNILSPGGVETDAWQAMPERESRKAEMVRRTPLGRLVTPEEVAWTAHFLCSEASSGIVGHTLVVDGGASILE